MLEYFSVRFKTFRWDIQRYKRSAQAFCAIREDPQCCLGSPCCRVSLHGLNCCCDEACISYNDCCPDYISTCQAGPCNQYSIIQNEEKRSPGYVMNITTDLPISDEMINNTWYRVISGNGEEMPKYPPGILHCGTANPIWLNDSLPTTEEGNLARTACMQTSHNVCEEEITIDIVNCPAGFYVYNLKNTSKDSAYCFVSPKVEPLLINGPTFNIPNYSPTPSLLPVFRCRFNDIANGTYVYDVYWYINGHNVTMFKNIEFHDINITFLRTSDWINEYQMNMNPAKTEYTVIEGENITIPMTSTVPVSCIASHPDIRTKCAQNFFIFQPKYGKNEASCLNSIAKRDIVFEAEFCGIKLGNLDWNETKYLQVYGSSDGIYNHQGRSTFIRISTKSVSPFNEIWRDIKIPEIKVTILDKDSVLTTRLCQSYNDPHITTFDGKLYHYMEVGEFVLYRNDRGPYWITLQIGTEIKFTVVPYSKFISGISIKPSIYDIDAARGLCGVPSVTKDNSDDFTHRDLGPISDEKSFADSWRINSSSSPNEQLFIKEPAFMYDDVVIYMEENTKVNVTVSKYCVCDKEAGPTDNLEQFYTVRCNLTESTQHCSSETNENDNSIQPFVTSCYYNTRKKRSLSHQINRRSATYNDDVIDDSPLEYDDDIQNTTFTNPEFRNGWTEVEANKTCTERIQNSVPTEFLTDVCGLTSDDYIKSSYGRHLIYKRYSWGYANICLNGSFRNESLAIQGTGDGNQTILEYITSLICPNNCSDNGNCTSGICSCYEGYVEDDCSKQTSTPPSNILLPTNGLCGTRSRGCTRTNIFGAFPSTNVWCKRRHFQILNNTHEYTSDAEIVKAEYRNAFMISVDLQSSRRKRSVSTEVVAEGYELSLSNDGNQFGDSVNMIIYDDECYSCNASSIICIVLDTCPELTSPNTESSSEHTTPSRGTSPKLTTSIAEITSNTAMTSSEMSNSGEATPSVLTTSTPDLSSREGAAELTLTTMVKHVTTTLKPLTEVYTILTSKEMSKDETTSPFEPTHKKDETTTVFKPTIKEIESTSKQSTTIYSNEGQETTISTEISTKSKTTKSTEKQTEQSSATSFKLITTDIKRANTIHDTSEPITTDSFISTEESTTPSTTSTNIKLTSTETAINQKLTTDHSEKTTNEQKTTNFNLMSTDKTTKQMATTTNDPTTLQSTTEHRKKNDIVSSTTKDTFVTNTETMNTLSITEQETTIVIDGQTTSKQSTEGEKSFIFTEPTTTLSTTKQESTITTTDQSTTLSSTEQHTAISNNEPTTTLSNIEQDKTITADQPTTKLSVTEQETTTITSQPTRKLL
ncbi:unnamed protein product [Mytilus edulis]|uniref:SMB domain-containing protein n=1 Tax=Mytilus edulis TaxID=6550 RepID=A0A8S3SYC5_MYTED|nr:unnamed protein product [Mytilus edulis]